jgi:hypothetical protein
MIRPLSGGRIEKPPSPLWPARTAADASMPAGSSQGNIGSGLLQYSNTNEPTAVLVVVYEKVNACLVGTLGVESVMDKLRCVKVAAAASWGIAKPRPAPTNTPMESNMPIFLSALLILPTMPLLYVTFIPIN